MHVSVYAVIGVCSVSSTYAETPSSMDRVAAQGVWHHHASIIPQIGSRLKGDLTWCTRYDMLQTIEASPSS